MLVQPLDVSTGEVRSEPALALDSEFGAGPGDTVLLLDEGSGARQIIKNPKAPVRLVVCGIVDSYSIGDKESRFH